MDPFLGEIRFFSFGFAPAGWAKCDGATMVVQQNTALYSLLGVKYGGDGKTNFLLPDLRGRVALAAGSLAPNSYAVGKAGGAEGVALTIAQIPTHSHDFNATDTVGDAVNVGSNTDKFLLAAPKDGQKTPRYGAVAAMSPMAAGTVVVAGGGQPHNNIQPSLVLNPCIATTGLYPPRS